MQMLPNSKEHCQVRQTSVTLEDKYCSKDYHAKGKDIFAHEYEPKY